MHCQTKKSFRKSRIAKSFIFLSCSFWSWYFYILNTINKYCCIIVTVMDFYWAAKSCTKISHVDVSQLIYPNRKPNSKEYSLIIVGTEKTNTVRTKLSRHMYENIRTITEFGVLKAKALSLLPSRWSHFLVAPSMFNYANIH